MRIALVIPHIFMHPQVLPGVIFSPGRLAIALAEGLQAQGDQVTIFAPGKVSTSVPIASADMSYFDAELAGRGDSYMDLLKKHPFTFITLARQVQSEIIAAAFARANSGQFDVVHVYCNEEDMALPFAALCTKPVIFTHHDPFNFLIKYKNVFPKYKHCNWLSMSYAQRAGMPSDTNWVANIYHGLAADIFHARLTPKNDQSYIAYIGRIIQPKGVHVAITALQTYNARHPGKPLKLKIAGKHYGDNQKDDYWREHIVPQLDDPQIEYVGFINDDATKQAFLGGAQALIIPSIFDEPFGIVMIEALACGTPLIGLDSGAIPEVITQGVTGFVVPKQMQVGAKRALLDEAATATGLADALERVHAISRTDCRTAFEERFTLERMVRDHQVAYQAIAATK